MARWIWCVVLLLAACDGSTVPLEAPEVPLPPPPTPPGAGLAFVLDHIGVIDPEVDGACTVDRCADELDAAFVERFFGGSFEPLRHDGNMLVLFELAGVEASDARDDERVALRVYRGRDADERSDNDFSVPPGETDCCTFRFDESSLDRDVPIRAKYELSSHIEDGFLVTDVPGRVAIPWPRLFQPLWKTLTLEAARARIRLASDLSTLEAGLLGGVATFSALDDVDNPYCPTISPRCPTGGESMLDLIVQSRRQPDVDLDGDGLECALDLSRDGHVDTCCDGVGVAELGCDELGCRGAIVPPLDPASPTSCVDRPEMADGLGITFAFTGVPATIQLFP